MRAKIAVPPQLWKIANIPISLSCHQTSCTVRCAHRILIVSNSFYQLAQLRKDSLLISTNHKLAKNKFIYYFSNFLYFKFFLKRCQDLFENFYKMFGFDYSSKFPIFSMKIRYYLQCKSQTD